mgnify:CR=1 FL=1
MEYQLKLLKIFNKDGFSKIVDLIDDLLTDEDTLLNFIILNINNTNNTNNFKYLCNFLKKNIPKYKNVIYKIIDSDNITLINKSFFLLYILNTYDKNNIELINNTSLYIILENLKYNITILEKNNTESLNNIILYKILNNDIFGNDIYDDLDSILNYYKFIFNKLFILDSNLLLNFVYCITNIYNYRCKTFSTTNLTDNILFILIHIIYGKLDITKENTESNTLIINCIKNNIDLNNITYNDVKTYEVNLIYDIVFLKLVHITFLYSINEIENNNTIICENEVIIDKINNTEILESFKIIQKYILLNNEKNIKKYKNLNIILYNKLNKKLLIYIFNYYIILIDKLYNNPINNSCELLNNIITNMVDFYIFYTGKYHYVYSSLEEKYNSFDFFNNLFTSEASNVNLDIKLIDLFSNILIKENMLIKNKNNINLYKFSLLLNKTFTFYTTLDKYEDYYKDTIKYRIIFIYNNLFYKNIRLEDNLYNLLDINKFNKFLISLIEDININTTNFIIYYKLYLTNRDYSTIANTQYIYLQECLRFYKFLLNEQLENININIIEISIHKINKAIHELNKLCHNKDNIYKIMLYMIDIYLILNTTKYIQIIKNDTIFFNYNNFINIADNLYTIHKHKNITNFKNMLNDINVCDIIVMDDFEDIPEEFLDPLYNTLIIIPIILPSSGHFVDYDIIKKHLLYHNFDPFNRANLTLEILDTYNNQEEIKKKNNDFKLKIDEWIKINNI